MITPESRASGEWHEDIDKKVEFLLKAVEETKLTIRELINGPQPGESMKEWQQKCRETLFHLTAPQDDGS